MKVLMFMILGARVTKGTGSDRLEWDYHYAAIPRPQGGRSMVYVSRDGIYWTSQCESFIKLNLDMIESGQMTDTAWKYAANLAKESKAICGGSPVIYIDLDLSEVDEGTKLYKQHGKEKT